jgi:hypothetical protein
VFSPKNNRIKHNLTILLLVVFILIRISPDYFLCQFSPQSERVGSKELSKTHTGSKSLGADSRVRADKSIDDKVDTSLIPVIKFAGIPFEIFFLGSLLLPVKFTGILPHISRFGSEAGIIPCILRL